MQTGAGELAAILGKLLERNLLIGVDPRRRVISLAIRFAFEGPNPIFGAPFYNLYVTVKMVVKQSSSV